ncbi:MAG: glycosyl hydrolase family 95 catalytic domain-containing protein [Armatimonadota bacterium]
MLDWQELKRILARHDLMRREFAATPWDGLVLGNGEMGAVVFGGMTGYTWRLNRNDLWDARWPDVADTMTIYPLSEFKRIVFKESVGLAEGERITLFDRQPWHGAPVPYPCRRIGADFVLRMTPPVYGIQASQRLRLADATLQGQFPLGLWGKESLQVESRVLAERDVLAVRIGNIGGHNRNFLMCALRRDPLGGRTWDNTAKGEWGVRDWKDPRVGALPPAQVRVEGKLAILIQEFPGDADADPYALAVVACNAEGYPFRLEESGDAIFNVAEHGEVTAATFYVATATHAKAREAEAEARRLVEDAAQAGWQALEREHQESWQRYWMESSVELGERAVERNWYRTSYQLAINARAGGTAPGLFGIALPYDCPPWRGDRHNNYPEYSSIFWGSYPANHLDRALNYTEFIEGMMPTARRIAREVFECEGAAFNLLTIDRTRRYYFDNLWSHSLYLTATHAQNLWWHYQYSGDREYLRERAYPIMAECADFYAALVAKNPPGDYTLWPTVPTEYRGIVKDFALNKNMIEDLAMVKFLMRAVVEASELLNADAERRQQWIDLRDHIPDYATMEVEGQTVFADVEGNTELPPYNHSLGLAPFFPGEDPAVYGNGRWREVAERTMDFRTWSDGTRYGVAYARLGRVREAMAKAGAGQRSNGRDDANCSYAGSSSMKVIAELLLSSYDGVIRVFPAWEGHPARFRDLRAIGGFRVSAAYDGTTIGPITLTSDGGNPAVVQAPWPSASVVDVTSGERIKWQVNDDCLAFPTRPGHAYEIRPREGDTVSDR